MGRRASDGPAGDPGRWAPPATAAASLARRGRGTLAGRRMRLAGTVYLLLDLSASMADEGKMPELLRGAVRLFYGAWCRRYAVGVIGFGREVRVLSGATRNPHRFQRSLAGLRPDGGTAMAAALDLAVARLRGRAGRRVAVLITDGMPDDRRATLDAAARARALGLTVVAVGTGEADETFLRALGSQPELAEVVHLDDFADGIGRAAGSLVGG